MSRSRLTVRPATPDDIVRLVEIHTTAFPDSRGFEARERNFTSNRLGTLSHLRVVEMDADIVGHAFLFHLTAGFGGRWVKTAGIASVGVAPHARGQGVARVLLDALHEEANGEGDAIALLYPFRQGFYSTLGYAPVSPYRAMRICPKSVPESWRKSAHASVRPATGDDRAAIIACYERAALRGTGRLRRPESLWDERFSDEKTFSSVVRGAGGGLLGYIAWGISQREAHAKTTLRVREIIADTDAAYTTLFGFIGCLRDQAHEVDVDLDATDPIDRALLDADQHGHGTEAVEHPVGTVATGPMVRLLDPMRALLQRGYTADGDLSFELSDGPQPPIHLSVRGGKARAGDRFIGPRIALSSRSLSALAFGSLRLSEALRLGWATCDGDLAHADQLLALPPFFSTDPF